MKRLLAITLVTLVCLLMVVGRVVWSSRVQLRHARTFSLDDETITQRIFYLGMAARLYVPLNPYSSQALDELITIGDTTSRPAALAANRAARSAILATRSFYTREPASLARINQRIAAQMADLEVAADPAHTDRQKSSAWHLAKLDEDTAPSVAWSLVAIAGFAIWASAAFLFCRRAFAKSENSDEEKFRRPIALASVGGVIVGMLLFLLGLHRA